MSNSNRTNMRKVTGGLVVTLASALLSVPFVAVGAFVFQIY